MPEDDSSPDSKPSPRLGSYLLVKALGSGGMSNVFRAVHEETGSVVAVKVLPRTLAKNATLLQRFIREAKSAESLDHPNIAAIYDRGFDQGRHYLVLEYVEGRDMHDRVRINGPLEPEEAVRFIREVAQGLRYAASRGMIHRDVKPANLMMTPDGHAKIIDLGLALQTDDEDERVTRDGTTVGTVDYMAPEQARDSRQTSERSDIYSLGCTFYYLMTGAPPYPGGNLSDKLARHYRAPIPDVRQHRQDVSESLSLLIRRMMEKKPEPRYADYDQLIAALDSLEKPSSSGDQGVVLDALIVDDDEDDEIGLAPTESAITRSRQDRPPSTRDQVLMAEIVDEEVEENASPPSPSPSRSSARPSGSKSRSRETALKREASLPDEVSLSELAALDANEPREQKKAQRSSSSSPALKPVNPVLAGNLPGPALDAILEEDDDDPMDVSEGPPRRGSDRELPLKTWIAAGLLVGLSIAIVGFGVSMLITAMKPEKLEVAERPIEEASPVESVAPASISPTPRPKGASRPPPKIKPAQIQVTETPKPVEVVVEAPPVEEAYPSEWETRLFSRPSTKQAPFEERPSIVLRRVLEAGDAVQTTSLAAALSQSGEVVEIADTGPFFEDDCQVAGKSRLIRARGGLRPIIKIDSTLNDVVKEQTAKWILGGSRIDRLVLEGLDLAVDVRDLPDHQRSLFLCQGASLTLRDCSLTILNANDATRANKFSVFRVEDGLKPNVIVLERSIIRGPVRTLVDVAAAGAEVILDRSVIVGDAGPLIQAEAVEKPSRSFIFHRSLIATRGLVLEFAGRSTAPVVRSLGTTFARVDGGTIVALFSSKAAFPGEPSSVLDWAGEDNTFAGWSGLLATGPEGAIRVPGLSGIRAAWPGSDSQSEESPAPWPVTVLRDEAIPTDFASLAPDRRGTLFKVARPHPMLKDLALGSLAKLPAPELSLSLVAPYIAPQQSSQGAGGAKLKVAPLPPPQPNASGPRLKASPPVGKASPPKAMPGPLNLIFNVWEAPWMGDLGLFLAEKLVEGTTHATIHVRGSGVIPTSPVRLPDGISVAIMGDSIEGSKLPMPTFVPKPSIARRSMFDLRGGDLAIANLAFSSEEGTRPLHWVRVEDGLLAIRHCRIRDSGKLVPDVGAAVSFVARGVAPIVPRVGPFVSSTDRPTARLKDCLIWTAGEAISAELGRGVVDLENCLILSGGSAVSLWPQQVRHDKFEADLVLDRCTIGSDKFDVFLGPWQGDPAGPARPWLVSTRRCVYPRMQASGVGGLLQVDPESMARGTLFWQSISDAYEVSRFLATTGPPPSSVPSPDLKKQWVHLWGAQHTKGDFGPNPRRNDPILRYLERPRPGRVVPGSLELDAKLQKDMGVNFKNLPPIPRT